MLQPSMHAYFTKIKKCVKLKLFYGKVAGNLEVQQYSIILSTKNITIAAVCCL